MHFSQLFSSVAYFKVCFEVRKTWLPFFRVDPYYILSTSVLNDIILHQLHLIVFVVVNLY